ncbi:MAG: acyl carrier protein, partial [Lachnospiraceae bacterium]|nr:acyl carrier protein [Lachnospiraceae bacterium]
MKREEIFERLNEVFQDVFDDKSITVNEKTTANDIEKWDSLEHINLILAVETEFGMKF